MRRRSRPLPDGRYAHGHAAPTGSSRAFHVRGRGDDATATAVVVDYAGTRRRSAAGDQLRLTYTFAMSAYRAEGALLPDLPNNEGIFRTIEVTAPEGCIVNPRGRSPSAGAWRRATTCRPLIFGALAEGSAGQGHGGRRLARSGA